MELSSSLYYYLYSFVVVLSHSIIAVLLVLSLFRPISNDQEQGDKTRPKRGFKSNPETKRKTVFVSKTQLDGSSNPKQKRLIALQEISADQEQGDKTKAKRGCKSNPETKRKTGFVSKTQLVDDSTKPKEKKLIPLQEISAETESCGSRKSCELSGSAEKIVSAESCDLQKCEIVDATEKIVSDEHGNNVVSSAVYQCQESLIDQRLICVSYGETEIDLAKEEVGPDKIESLWSEVTEEVDCMKEELLDEDDEWEGIERTELDTRFDSAVAYVGSKANAYKKSKLRSDLKLQLYGLHKISMEGPCYTPQPMAFNLSARAKWNAWQKLGNMRPEDAMEQYMNLVTTLFPEWMKDDSQEVDDQDNLADAEESREKLESYSMTNSESQQLGGLDERNPEDAIDHTQGFDAGPNPLKQQNLTRTHHTDGAFSENV